MKQQNKTSSLRSRGALALAAATALTTQSFAGTAPAPVEKPSESGALFKKLNGTLEAGYDSAYYFRGLWFSSNNAWEALNISIPVTDKLSLGFGTVYTSSIKTRRGDAAGLKYSELDLIGSASYDAGFAKFGLVYTYYNFFDTFSGSKSINGVYQTFGNAGDGDSTLKSAQDLGFTIGKSFGALNTSVGMWYDFRVNGRYYEASMDYTFKPTSWLSLVPSVATGYGQDYYSYRAIGGVGSGFTHVRPALTAPIQLTDNVIFTPYVAANLSGSARYNRTTASNIIEGRNDIYFGAKLGVSF
jgi:hypothetical protein